MTDTLERTTASTPTPSDRRAEGHDDGQISHVGWVRRMLPFLLRHRWRVAAAVAVALMSIGVTASVPLVLRTILDTQILAAGNSLVTWIGVLLGLGVVRMLSSGLRRYTSTSIALHLEFDLRTAIYDHLQRLDFARHDEMQTGQLVSRANTDVRRVEGVLTSLPMVSSNILLFVLSLTFMLVLSPALTVVALLVLPAVAVITHLMRKVVYPSSYDAQARAAEVAGVVEEAVAGVRVVKGFGQEDRELRRLRDTAATYFGTRMRNIRIMAKFQPMLQTLPTLGQVGVLAVGGWLVVEGNITLGTFLAFSTYLVQLIAPVRQFAGFLAQTQNARASAERIFEILDSTPLVTEKDDAVTLVEAEGRLDFDDVRFGYLRSEPVLDGFSLSVEPGETVALVGASGSGKSTVALLLPRFYDVQDGATRIDGLDVRDLTLDSLRRHVGMVFEDSFLFSDSVYDNIAYGRPDATREEVERAARAAGAHDFTSRLPDGYDTIVGEQGYTLSGGQRQRVALARALLTNPPVLILDDATSSVDAATEEAIHETLRELMPGRTTLIVAHRKSTLDLASRIVVVDQGRVVDSGTHEELVARCQLYRDLLAGPDDLDSFAEHYGDTDGEAAGREGVTESAWPDMDDELEALARARSSAGVGAGSRGGGQRFAAAATGETPEEMQALIDALPPVKDDPEIDEDLVTEHSPRFGFGEFLRPWVVPIALAGILVMVEAGLTLAGPAIIQWGVDEGVRQGLYDVVLTATIVFLAVTFADWVMLRVVQVYTGKVGQRMLYGLRLKIFAQLQRLAMDYYDREMAGRIMTRMTSDIEAFQALFQNGIVNALVSLITFVGAFVILLTMNTELALVSMMVVIPLSIATVWFQRKQSPAWLEVRERVAAVNANLQESISGVRVAQAYTREQRNMHQFREVANRHLDARMRTTRIQALYFPFVEFLSIGAQALVVGYGAGLVRGGELQIGELMAFVLYLTQVFAPIQQLSRVFDTYQRAAAAMQKFRELMAEPITTPSSDHPVHVGRIEGDVELRKVRFRYPRTQEDALRGVDLHIAPGETVALVGETGAGKSTIMKLIARFYDVADGVVLIDGVPLVELDPIEYHQNLGYVPQEGFLFTGTVRDNIAYARPQATEAEIEGAARAVGAHDFIASLPYGYHTPITERGRSLSAGQRQLIALARAQLVDPAILLLDEATSNLDLVSEAKVNHAMQQVAEGRTTILIAHRLQTARRAHRIVVVHDGQVAEDGTHEALLAEDGRYAALWKTYAAGLDQPALTAAAGDGAHGDGAHGDGAHGNGARGGGNGARRVRRRARPLEAPRQRRGRRGG